jgi:hypothetical protein
MLTSGVSLEDRLMESHFGRPQALTRLGQFIMDVKVKEKPE